MPGSRYNVSLNQSTHLFPPRLNFPRATKRIPIMAVISIRSAQLAFGHVPLLDHAEFSLETGERVGLIGRNGTGKSSLLKIISGRSSSTTACWSCSRA